MPRRLLTSLFPKLALYCVVGRQLNPIVGKCNATFSGNFDEAAAITVTRADGAKVEMKGEVVANGPNQSPYTTLVTDFGDTYVGTLTYNGRVEKVESNGPCRNYNAPSKPAWEKHEHLGLFLNVRQVAQ